MSAAEPDRENKPPPQVVGFRRAVAYAWQAGKLSREDLSDLMVLAEYARSDGSLRAAGQWSSSRWWREHQLAGFLRITAKTFRARFGRWREAGWVGHSKPENPALPTERWLFIPSIYAKDVRSFATQPLPDERAVVSTSGTTARRRTPREVIRPEASGKNEARRAVVPSSNRPDTPEKSLSNQDSATPSLRSGVSESRSSSADIDPRRATPQRRSSSTKKLARAKDLEDLTPRQAEPTYAELLVEGRG